MNSEREEEMGIGFLASNLLIPALCFFHRKRTFKANMKIKKGYGNCYLLRYPLFALHRTSIESENIFSAAGLFVMKRLRC